MKRVLLSRVLFSCSHQFTWPRRDESGNYYQLCVNCGSKYRYDWKRMRRTSRVEDDLVAETRAAHRPTRPVWVARERRLRHVVPVKYRVIPDGEWLTGSSENLSRSGLLFRCSSEVAIGATIEVQLEMPPELAGEPGCEVTCRGTAARVTPDRAEKEARDFLVACAIEDYGFGATSDAASLARKSG